MTIEDHCRNLRNSKLHVENNITQTHIGSLPLGKGQTSVPKYNSHDLAFCQRWVDVEEIDAVKLTGDAGRTQNSVSDTNNSHHLRHRFSRLSKCRSKAEIKKREVRKILHWDEKL